MDASLRRPEDPAPSDTRARIFPLDLADHLIGRRSDKDDIHPEIVWTTPASPAGTPASCARPTARSACWTWDRRMAPGSNGAPVEPNVPTPLADGSEITLGCWTRLTVRAR